MKTTGLVIAVLAIILPFKIYCQTGYSDAGARTIAMGNASVTMVDVFSAQNNQAALGYLEHGGGGISTLNYFMVDGGINSYYGVFALPVKTSGTFGLTLNYKGDPTFNQSKIGLGYGRKLAEELAVGLQLDYIGTSASEVGSGSAFTFDIGVLYKPAQNVTIGAKAFNPIRAKTGLDYEQELPAIINVGLNYHPSEKIYLCAEAEQEIEEILRGKFGIEYQIIDQLFLRGGYVSNPSMFSCGIGLKIQQFKLDLAAQFHQQLGLSPGFGLSYDLSK